MNYLICLRLTHLKGLFWGDRFLTYGRRWGCQNTRTGWGRHQQALARRLADGALSAPRVGRRAYPYGLMQNLGLGLLGYNLALLPKTRPWAWAVIHQLQIRSYRSSRYKLGLPANGQRTHTNANTTGRATDPVARFIRRGGFVLKIWEARKPSKFISKAARRKTSSKGGKARNVTKSGKTIRSKKKVDVWK